MRTNRCVIHNFDSLMDCRRWVFTCLVIASHSLPFGERLCSSTSLEDHRFRKSAKMIDSRQLLGEVAHESHNMPTACFLWFWNDMPTFRSRYRTCWWMWVLCLQLPPKSTFEKKPFLSLLNVSFLRQILRQRSESNSFLSFPKFVESLRIGFLFRFWFGLSLFLNNPVRGDTVYDTQHENVLEISRLS